MGRIPPDCTMNIVGIIAGFLSGIIGSMGLGGGAVLIIYLSVFTDTEQLTSQGINLLFFIPIGLLSVIIYSFKKKIKWKITIPVVISGLIGTVFGLMLTGFLGGELTTKIFGGMLIIIGIKELFAKKPKQKKSE